MAIRTCWQSFCALAALRLKSPFLEIVMNLEDMPPGVTYPSKAAAMRAGEATKGNYSVFPEKLVSGVPADPKQPWVLRLG